MARGSQTGEKTSHPEQQRKNIFLVRPLLFPILLALPFPLAQRGLGDAPESPSTEALSTCCNVFVASPWVGAQLVTGFGVGSTGGWPRVAVNVDTGWEEFPSGPGRPFFTTRAELTPLKAQSMGEGQKARERGVHHAF